MGRLTNHVSMRFLCVAAAVTMSVGCLLYADVMRDAIDTVAQRVNSDQADVVAKLRACANPRGEGVIVFVRKEADCGPAHSWLWLGRNRGVYAFDEGSHSLTPTLPRLSDAPPSTGAQSLGFADAVRAEICKTAR